MAAKPTQSREGVKGQLPLAESRGGASGGAWGNAPTVPRATSYAKRAQSCRLGRRQRSVPASNFARPQTRPQAALSTYSTLSRQMVATDQHREKSFSLAAGLFRYLRARLRTRKVTGRDASLPAPLLAASLELVARGTVGALPQTPAGTLSLHPARDIVP